MSTDTDTGDDGTITDPLRSVQDSFSELSDMQEEIKRLNSMLPERLTRNQRRLLKKVARKKQRNVSTQEAIDDNIQHNLESALKPKPDYFGWDGNIDFN